jgi:PAS domain S-box-containing protein
MTLRTKTFLVMSVAVVCSLAVLYVGSSTLLLRPFIRLDEDAARKNAGRARDALAEEISRLDTMAADYAAWDDTYAFIRNGNARYIKANMVDDTFTNLGIEAIVFVNSSGKVVYSKAMNLGSRAACPLPEGFTAEIAPGKPLVSPTSAKSGLSGILLLPGGPELVASRPIVTSDYRGPISGSLLMARRLDTGILDKTAGVTHLTLSLRPFGDRSLAQNVRSAVIEATPYRGAAAVRQKSGLMSGYAGLNDVYGRPALILRADGTDAIYHLGKVSLRYFLVSLAAIWLLLGLLAMLLLEEFVLSRLAKLSAGMKGIGTSGDLSGRVELAGTDELSHVAEAANGMLSALERSQRELRESEERYRALVEQSSEGVWRLELEQPLPLSLTEDEQVEHIVRHGVVAEANDLMAKMHGYQKAEEIAGVEAADLRDGPAMTEDQIRSFIRGGYRITDSETEQPGPHGRARYFLNNVVGIVENGALMRAWGMQRDITGRRVAEQELRAHSSAIDAATDQILITAPDGTIEFVNAAFERETGYSSEEMVGKHARVLESGEHPPAFYEALWRAMREGETWQGELISRRKDGGLFTADTIISPVKSDSGLIEHFISIKRDITQKKLYEERLDHLAHHDSLTGLPNRILLSKRLTERLVDSKANGRLLAVKIGRASCRERV